MSKIINEAPLDVKPYILESWKRCEEQGLDKNNGTGSTVDKKEFREILRQNTDLIAYGKPIIENLYDIIVNSDTILYIMDTDCVILALVGDEKIIERVKKEANLKVGSKWSEETIGTNAADLCMRLNKPIQTIGRDHYCISHYEATCCAAPIHNPEGRILGALVTTSMMDKVSQHSLGLVLAGTRLIENEAARFKISKLTEAGFNAIEEGMFITDGYYTVRRCNAAALEILGIGKEDLIGCDARTLFKDITFGKETLSIKNRSIIFKVNHREKPCFGSINSLKFNEVNMGIVVVFKRERQVNKMANRIMGNTASFTFDDILSKSEVMQGVINEAKKISGVNCSVLITGESGTGKELFAQSIHNASKRRSKPFIAINCAAIPSNLVESEIFGYEEGSFTGAKKNGKPGKFELADEGTLFLDEIGELPLDIQSKLLRVLDNHKVMRIGSNQEKMIDVRVIAATNRNLAEEVEKHNFRLDLLYRINTLTIKIPSLNERGEDIDYLAQRFLKRLNSENEKQIESIDSRFIEGLRKYRLKGNVRQLQNIITRAYFLCDDKGITEGHLPEDLKEECIKKDSVQEEQKPLISLGGTSMSLAVLEKELIIKAIGACDGNITQAAKALEIGKSTLYRKMEKYGIELKRYLKED